MKTHTHGFSAELLRHVSQKRNLTTWLCICLMQIQTGCGTWIGNPGTNGGDKDPDKKSSIQLTAGSSDGSTTLSDESNIELLADLAVAVTNPAGSSDGQLTLTEGYVVLKTIKFKSSVESADASGTLEGPFVVDLVNNKTTPTIPTIEMSSTSLVDIELKIEKLEAEKFKGTLPSQNIVDNTIYLAGTYTSKTGKTKPFKLSFSLSEEFKLSSSRSSNREFKLASGTNPVILAFRPSTWFNFSNTKVNEKKLDFNSITTDSITLTKDTEGTAKTLLEVIKENIKYSARFGKDDNGDGKLAKEEDDSQK